MNNNKCVIILGVPHSGENILGKILLELGYSAEGVDRDPSSEWALIAINQTICDNLQKPKMDLSLAQYARPNIDFYIEEKTKIGKPWIINEPRMCMTVLEFIPFLKKHNIDYKIISIMRSPHHSAFDLMRSNKGTKLETASEIIGRYIVARSISTENFLVSDQEHKSKVIYMSADEMLDKPEQEVDSLIKLLELEVTEEQKNKAIEVVSSVYKPS